MNRAVDAALDVQFFGSGGLASGKVPEYSQSWALMGIVIERMRARGFYFEMGDRFGDDGEHPHGFYASFEPLAVRQERDQAGWLDQPDDQWWRHAATAPLAVCLAALAALGVEVEGVA